MKIIVLAGGLSPERDVSLSSGTLITKALIENGHEVMLLDVFLGSESKQFKPIYQTKDHFQLMDYQVEETSPDLESIRLLSSQPNSMIGKDVISLCQKADITFLALHGSMGENGSLQATLDNFGIKYTGTGYVGSLLAMDKDISKKMMVNEGILTAPWQVIDISKPYGIINVEFPCVVKPCSCGSSVGVQLVEDQEQLLKAIDQAKEYESHIMIEKRIDGREFSVGILQGQVLPVIEIIPTSGFYDYKNKYQAGLTREICPALLDDLQNKILQQTALKVHQILRLGSYSRVDFILDELNQAYCLEANTLPGMTPTSLLPQEAKANHISYNELCERIINGDTSVL